MEARNHLTSDILHPCVHLRHATIEMENYLNTYFSLTAQNEATEMEIRNQDTNTTIHHNTCHNPSRYMVEEGRPYQARLQGVTDMVTASPLNNNTTSHPGKLTWEGSRTDAIIGKITGEGTFEQITPGKLLQLRIEIKTDLKGATTS